MQNKLDELWSLLNFLMPSLFGSCEDFQRWFGVDCHLQEEEVLLVTNRLHQILRPFMLRRLKETVASELPSKVSLYQLALGRSSPCVTGNNYTRALLYFLLFATRSHHMMICKPSTMSTWCTYSSLQESLPWSHSQHLHAR